MMEFQYHATEDFGQPLKKKLGMYPRISDLTWDALRGCGSWAGWMIMRLQFRMKVAGRLPTDAKVAIVANHQSHLDTLAILASIPHRQRMRIAVLAAEDYFFTRTWKAMAASLLSLSVAFDRMHWTAIRAWYQHLKSAESGWILFYPSGSRKSTKLQEGLLRLLVKSGWTILPVRLEGTGEAWPAGQSCWHPFRTIRVSFKEPYRGDNIDELMQKLEKDLNA